MTQPEAPRRVRPRPTFRSVYVARVQRLTPHMLRVSFAGEELEGFTPNGPAEHIKVFFPKPGQERPILPEWGPEGPVYAEGQERPTSRTYTPRRWRPSDRELDVDFLLHGDGPGSGWARQASKGDLVTITGPGGPYRPAEGGERFVIAGDEAALPAIGTILDTLPSSAHAQVFIEVGDASEEMPLASAAQLDLHWLHRSAGAEAGRLVEATVRDVDLTDAASRLFVACEASIMRDIRRHLVIDRGIDRAVIHTHGYWKAGEANHPDHDVGQEI